MKQGFAQLAGQLLAIWKQLGLNQRISVVLATGALLAGLGGLAYFSSRTSYALLWGGLPEAEVARVTAALEDQKVAYQVRGGGNVYVPADQVYPSRAALAAKGIPNRDGTVGLELLDRPNWGVSDLVQRANLNRALEGELTRTVGAFDFVESARVRLAKPENPLIPDPRKKTTASVFIKVRGNATLSEGTVNAIRFLVANGVEGLTPNNVSVVDSQGNVLSENQDDASPGTLANTQLRNKEALERYLSRKAEAILSKVLGPGQAVVEVAADINWDARTTYEEKYDPNEQVMRSQTSTEKSVRSQNAPTGGAAGIASNTAAEGTNAMAAATSTPVTLTDTKDKTVNNQYELSRTVSSLLENAGSIRRLTAGVILAQQFSGSGTNRTPIARSTNELNQLVNVVKDAIGIVDADLTRSDRVTLIERPFNNQPLVELTQQLEQQQTRQYWTELALKLVYPALGMGIVLAFWRSLKRTRTEDITIGIPLGELVPVGANGNGNGHGHGDGNGFATAGGFGRKSEPKVVTVEVLNQLIRENPSNMTQAVRNWLVRGKPAK